jgi:hypothetical protein
VKSWLKSNRNKTASTFSTIISTTIHLVITPNKNSTGKHRPMFPPQGKASKISEEDTGAPRDSIHTEMGYLVPMHGNVLAVAIAPRRVVAVSSFPAPLDILVNDVNIRTVEVLKADKVFIGSS